MSLQYRDKNGNTQIISGLTPGGDIEAGAVMTRTGTITMTCGASTAETANVTFDSPMPDADYLVDLAVTVGNALGVTTVISNKTANGFDLTITRPFSSAVTITFIYTATKTYTVQHAEQTAADIADIKAMIPSSASSTNKFTTADDLRTETRALDRRLDDVEDVIPATASITNQLATQNDLSNIEIDELGEINDVDLTNLADGQTLVWDDTTSKWVNGQGGKTYTPGDGIDISNADVISAKVDDTSITTDTNDALKVADTYKTIFVGTQAQWDALSTAQKIKYNEAHITDDVIGGEVADSVTNGLMSPVTSNAVYDFVTDSISSGVHNPISSAAIFNAIANSTIKGNYPIKISTTSFRKDQSINIPYGMGCFFCFGRQNQMICGYANYDNNVTIIKQEGSALSASAASKTLTLSSTIAGTAIHGFYICVSNG